MQERSVSPEAFADTDPFQSQDQMEFKNSQDDQMNTKVNTSWSGTSITDLYRNNSPWNYYCPALSPSRHHTVLYEIPATLNNPPKPHYSAKSCHWNTNHVRMPFSPKNVFPVKENNKDVLKPRWDIIQLALLKPIRNSNELQEAIFSYNLRRNEFYGLHFFFQEVSDEDESNYFFSSLLPKIVQLALQLPELIQTPIPLLKQGKPHTVSLSQLQIASILANAFLCTFPWKKDYVTYPGINFNRLFESLNRVQVIAEKIKCLIHYFRRVCSKAPVGVVTFERKHLPKSEFPRWDKVEKKISNIKLHVSSKGTIENDGKGFLQVDFANCMIGGGILSYGCVQEEIRFAICPELIAACLFTEQLAPNEALLMTGVEQYSNYRGYSDTFEWAGNCNDETPYDDSGRRRTSIVAIDAIYYSNPSIQFSPSKIIRELNKAYVGFYENPCIVNAPLSPVATGNWGCGAFRGNLHLKALIQIMACTAAHRNIVYYTFGDKKLQYAIFNVYEFLVKSNITVVQLWRYLCRFHEARLPSHQLLPFIKQSHLDSLNSQRGIKGFFTNVTTKYMPLPVSTKRSSPKRKAETQCEPSTSKDYSEDLVQTIADSESDQINSQNEEDNIIEASQESYKDLRNYQPKVQNVKTNKSNEGSRKIATRSAKNIFPLFYSSDEDDSEGEKCDGFLSTLDNLSTKIDTKCNANSNLDVDTMELTSDDSQSLMEVVTCDGRNSESDATNSKITINEDSDKTKAHTINANRTPRNTTSKQKNLNQKITEFFTPTPK